MRNLLKSIAVKSYPILHLEFRDGFSGDLDHSETISKGPMFEPLKDPAFFSNVKMDERGYSFGWCLDQPGKELDFWADGARVDLETEFIVSLARSQHSKNHAAE